MAEIPIFVYIIGAVVAAGLIAWGIGIKTNNKKKDKK